MLVRAIKRGLTILYNPKKEFENLSKRTFEEVVADYVVLLILVAIVAGIASMVYSVGRAIYLDMSLDISIQYLRMINYSLGRSTSLLFFYLFAGTFLLFFLNMALRLFLRKVKYISLLKIIFYSLTPMLLFGWILPNPVPFGVWSIFLFVMGVKTYRFERVKKDSINRRE